MTDGDIYRDFSPRPRSPSIISLSSSSSSSSSALFPTRLGALAAVVEHAITRWARRRRSSSSGSTSSLSSRSSILTNTRSIKRSRRHLSSSSFLSANTERDFSAHVALIKARKESQRVPRLFSLYLPPSLLPEKHRFGNSQQLTITASLPLVLNRLESTLKHSLKAQRAHKRVRVLTAPSVDLNSASSTVHTDSVNHFAKTTTPGNRKGKGKANSLPTMMEQNITVELKPRLIPKAWYLDVASPSWEDLRAIGKLLHLHPLTLEDILQNESREKLELFPKLGYYFVTFRTIDTRNSHDRAQRQDIPNANSLPNESLLSEANVYLTVFRDGICSFHFTDISEHTDRIKNRIRHLEEVFNMSSDWIAHGLLDSIVDSFFPYLEQIDKEVVAIDKLVFSRHDQMSEEHVEFSPLESVSTAYSEIQLETSGAGQEDDEKIEVLSEKIAFERTKPTTRLTIFGSLGRFRHLWTRWKASKENLVQNSKDALRRIARARRLVTSLSRLLATKSDVVAQIRKRLLTDGHFGEGLMARQDALDIAIYMGDIQDHIFTLQHSLAHYERILGQLHPTYLSQLRTDALTKSDKGKALLYLTFTTVAILCIQSYIGLLSMNVYLPHNERDPSGSYHVFAFVLSMIIMILIVYSVVVRRWWEQAKRRHKTRFKQFSRAS
ncbi:hypothetical protein AX15_001821 [Amanita polypyramis BW_CC]|nr:hypothetical protein AX15_001821 [Amanita polypyramis BW_CC]